VESLTNRAFRGQKFTNFRPKINPE